MNIENEDELARWLFSPKDTFSILNNSLGLIQITSDNFQFSEQNKMMESVCCLRFFGDDQEDKCHSFGLEKLKSNNEARAARAIKTKNPQIDQIYTGYTSASYLDVINLSDDNIDFEVHPKIENGNPAHCNVHMCLKEATETMTRSVKKTYKNAARKKISDKFNKLTPYASSE